MIQAPPWLGLSGNPRESAVAPGTATVVCFPALAWSSPRMEMNNEPNSGAIRLPSSSDARCRACSSSLFALSAANIRFCATRGRLAILVQWTENAGSPSWPDRSKQTIGLVPSLSVS